MKKEAEVPQVAEHSELSRYELFQMFDTDGKAIAESKVHVRHGVRWVGTVWVQNTFRRHGLGRKLLRAVVDTYQAEPLWLQVLAFDGQIMPDEALIKWYTGFGFCATGAPGILMRPAGPLTLEG